MFCREQRAGLLASGLALAVAAGSCTGPSNQSAADVRPARSGPILVDGSATLLPLSQAVGDAFVRSNSRNAVSSNGSETSRGLERLCKGEIDLAGASRPINTGEMQECRARGVEFYELPVAFDSLSLVVNLKQSDVSCLTVSELKSAWSKPAQGVVTNWNQIRPGLDDRPLSLIGPGAGSGTFDYFTLAIDGEEGSARSDYLPIDNPADLATHVANVDGAMGFLGFAHYLANKDRLKVLAIDNGQGCVAPSADTVVDESYQPLTRPLFVYTTAAALARPEVRAFVKFYLSPDRAASIRQLGYVPLPTATSLSISRHIDKNLTGTMFGGRGSVIGITAAIFEDDERVRNALVR